MAEKRTRRRFTAEFKAQAVGRLLDGGKGLGEVATELGLSPGQLSGWRDEHLAAGARRRRWPPARPSRPSCNGSSARSSGSRRRSRSSGRPRLLWDGPPLTPARAWARRLTGEEERTDAEGGGSRDRPGQELVQPRGPGRERRRRAAPADGPPRHPRARRATAALRGGDGGLLRRPPPRPAAAGPRPPGT